MVIYRTMRGDKNIHRFFALTLTALNLAYSLNLDTYLSIAGSNRSVMDRMISWGGTTCIWATALLCLIFVLVKACWAINKRELPIAPHLIGIWLGVSVFEVELFVYSAASIAIWGVIENPAKALLDAKNLLFIGIFILLLMFFTEWLRKNATYARTN